MMWHIANSLQRAFEVADGEYDVIAPENLPQYAFSQEGVQGVLFEQEASYG